MKKTNETRMSKRDKALQGKLSELMLLLTKSHLRETTAWIKGDKKAVDKAKTEYGELACRINRMIEGWGVSDAEL